MTDMLPWLGLALIPAFLLLDVVYQRRRFAATRLWRLRGLVVTALAVGLSLVVATGWGTLFGDAHLLDLSSLGTLGGALVGVLVYEFFHYWYHRAAHRFDWLWRSSHQMHHSAEALDAFSAYYLSPLDVFNFTTLSSLVFFPMLGVSLEAGLWGSAFLTFNAMFQHANVATPRWLGYLIQRPESHGIHHERGVHRHNYSDLPLWDMVFGTFENPEAWEGSAGFYDGASTRILDMLRFRDVSTPQTQRPAGQDLVSSTSRPSALAG